MGILWMHSGFIVCGTFEILCLFDILREHRLKTLQRLWRLTDLLRSYHPQPVTQSVYDPFALPAYSQVKSKFVDTTNTTENWIKFSPLTNGNRHNTHKSETRVSESLFCFMGNDWRHLTQSFWRNKQQKSYFRFSCAFGDYRALLSRNS